MDVTTRYCDLTPFPCDCYVDIAKSTEHTHSSHCLLPLAVNIKNKGVSQNRSLSKIY